MNRAQYLAYDNKMQSITDPVELQAAMDANKANITQRSKYPTFASLGAGWGFVALFLLTGFLSGWTVGVLWVVATIASAGLASSVIAGIAGYLKYHKYFRALKTREKLAKLQKDGKNHFDKERMRLETRLNKDLAYCRRKRLISSREVEVLGNALPRPEVLPEDVVSAEREKIKAEAEALNHTMEGLQDDTLLAMADEREKCKVFDENISKGQHFEGVVEVSAQARDEDGKPKVNENGEPVLLGANFNALSDKDFALLLKGIATNLGQKYDSDALPLPITIQTMDRSGNMLDALNNGTGTIIIDRANVEAILKDGSPLIQFADNIISQLPPAPEKEKPNEKGAEKDEKVYEEEQAHTR